MNFVQEMEDGIMVRTYERGVENETLSCGTGVTAAALAAALHYGLESPINIQTKGGMLSVSFDQQKSSFYQVILIGPATQVFTGNIELNQ